MQNRIAPNNQFPATHFIDVWEENGEYRMDIYPVRYNSCETIEEYSVRVKDIVKPIAIFKIRPNKVPTIHKF